MSETCHVREGMCGGTGKRIDEGGCLVRERVGERWTRLIFSSPNGLRMEAAKGGTVTVAANTKHDAMCHLHDQSA